LNLRAKDSVVVDDDCCFRMRSDFSRITVARTGRRREENVADDPEPMLLLMAARLAA
jgi:hypothetical protein